MIKYTSLLFVSFYLATVTHAAAISPGDYYVVPDKLNVRLAPAVSSKVTNILYRHQRIEVLEVNDGWARISRYYDGSAEGVSAEVACWVSAQFLSTIGPAEANRIDDTASLEKAIVLSDDYPLFHTVFVDVSQELIRYGQCSLQDFKEMGGWWRSTNHESGSIYFTYCGGTSQENRIYLNATIGKTFR